MIDQAAVQAPAGDAMEAALAEARAELAKEATAEPTAPADSAQDSQPADSVPVEAGEAPKEGDQPTETQATPEEESSQDAEKKEEDAKPKESRRATGKALREQIEADVSARHEKMLAEKLEAFKQDFFREQESRTQQQAATADLSNQSERLRTLATGVKDGDWESTKEIAEWTVKNIVGDGTSSPKLFAALTQRGREAAWAEISKDFIKLKGVEGVDGEAYSQLIKAPTIPDLVQRALAIGKQPLEAAISEKDERIAQLQGQVTDLKGKLAGRAPSPEVGGGQKPSLPKATAGTWEESVQLSKEELGWPH